MINEIIHYEDEALVGLVLDYRRAAILAFLLGDCLAGDTETNPMYEALIGIADVSYIYGEFCDYFASKGGFSTHCYEFSEVPE